MNFLFGIVAGICLTLLLLYTRKPAGRLPADYWLINLLVVLIAIVSILAIGDHLPSSIVGLANGPFFFFLPAFLLLYVRRLTGHGGLMEWAVLVPGAGWALWVLGGGQGLVIPPWVPVWASLVFPLTGLATVTAYRRQLPDNVSRMTGVDLTWLVCLLTVAVLGTVAGGVLVVIQGRLPGFGVDALLAGVMAILIAQLLLTAWFGLRQGEVPKLPALAKSDRAEPATLNRIRQVMDDEELWREPDLRIGDLARRTAKTERAVSAAINQLAGRNFFGFVNAYRIEEAKRLLRNPEFAESGLLEIAYEAGFASKPSFNRIFKEVTGQTPSAWRAKAASDGS